MCTAISLKTNDKYFGRNLDIDLSYGEEVCIVPRNFPLNFRNGKNIKTHYAYIGMATVVGGTPLFYDAVNEFGLAVAGLNFPNNAYYTPLDESKINIAPFELIPYILSQCKSITDTKKLLENMKLADISFSENLPNSPLHFIVCDGDGSIVIEPTKEGLNIYDNKYEVLTNNPPFPFQVENLKNYENLRADSKNVKYDDSHFCQGLGAVGLPGDVSSMSRFVRVVFLKQNSRCDADEYSSVGQFFHILSNVEMVKGACITDKDSLDFTLYSCCMNMSKGLYYYKTYTNSRINCINMHSADLDGDKISRFALQQHQEINYQNA